MYMQPKRYHSRLLYDVEEQQSLIERGRGEQQPVRRRELDGAHRCATVVAGKTKNNAYERFNAILLSKKYNDYVKTQKKKQNKKSMHRTESI